MQDLQCLLVNRTKVPSVQEYVFWLPPGKAKAGTPVQTSYTITNENGDKETIIQNWVVEKVYSKI